MGQTTAGMALSTPPLLSPAPLPLTVDTGLAWGDFGGGDGRPSPVDPGGISVAWDAAVPGGGPNWRRRPMVCACWRGGGWGERTLVVAAFVAMSNHTIKLLPREDAVGSSGEVLFLEQPTIHMHPLGEMHACMHVKSRDQFHHVFLQNTYILPKFIRSYVNWHDSALTHH